MKPHLLLAVLVSLSPPVSAATKTWNGSSSNRWNTAANWTPSGIPAAGDDLVFPSAGMNKAMTNDIPLPARQFSSLAFTGSGYSVGGHAVALTGGIQVTHAIGGTSIAIGITVAALQTFSVTSQLALLTVSGDVQLDFDLTLASNGGQTYSGVLSGPGGLTAFNGPGVTLSGANTYGGLTLFGSGSLTIQNDAALGSASGATTVNGATLVLDGNLSVPAEPLTMNGASATLRNLAGSSLWGGPVVLNAVAQIQVMSGSALNIFGPVSGSGGLNVTATGALELSGNSTFTGSVTWSGVLQLGSDSALGAVPSAASCPSTGYLELLNGITVPNALTLGTVNCILVSVANDNTWNGPIQLPAAPPPYVQVSVQPGSTLTIGGAVSGAGFFKTGVGTLTLTAGNLGLNGQLQAGTTNIFQHLDVATLSAGATVGGYGGFNTLDASGGGTVAPGVNPGNGNIGVGVSLTLGSMATLFMKLNGVQPGTTYDTVTAGGTISLGGATLAGTIGFSPPVGSTFRILDNLTFNPVGGTFAGLPESAYLRFSNTDLRISYAGGDGNDVVLTVIAPPTATIGVGGTTSFCPPGSVMLTAIPAGGTGSYSSYQWVLDGSPIVGAVFSTFSASTSGVYTVTVTDSVGVVSGASPPIFVGDSTSPLVVPPGDVSVVQTVCQ